MKINKSLLQKIIQEELEAVLDEFLGLPKLKGLTKRVQGTTLANKTAEEECEASRDFAMRKKKVTYPETGTVEEFANQRAAKEWLKKCKPDAHRKMTRSRTHDPADTDE
tara:strand:+ start:941 stop:1267 length:327 start_codon:yes stop_codon:yes gene_type:complete